MVSLFLYIDYFGVIRQLQTHSLTHVTKKERLTLSAISPLFVECLKHSIGFCHLVFEKSFIMPKVSYRAC